MSDSLGIKLGVEGEKEFKNALRDINQSFKVLGSEMKLATSEFNRNEKSIGSLTSKKQILNKEIDAQKDKISTLEKALSNASNSFGENDKRTQSWTIQLNNAKAELNGMENEVSENEKAIKDMGEVAEKSGSKFENFGSVIKGVGIAMGAIVIAASAAAIELGKEVVTAFADYEQLVGGIDTLFKDSSAEMQKYASNAYKTSGLSANEYMETVTSFSASLISSLGGDTNKAVEYADMAITDMSDNANKMGSSIESIQNAYQGFAKQNYGMLDNLKLGYGGSKTEMERLLADAEAISGVNYDISSYADVVSAIHQIQESMGVAGATALEAENTISGSITSLQASISNLMIGFGDSNADMEKLTANVIDALKSVITNVIPILENIISALPDVIDIILSAITDNLPAIINAATKIVMALLDGLIQSIPQITEGALQLILGLTNGLLDNLPAIINAAIIMVLTLALGIVDALPELIPAIIQTVVQIVDVLLQNMDKIIDGAFKIITGLSDGLIDALPQMLEVLPQIIESFISFFLGNIPKFIELGIRLNIELAKGLIKAIPQIVTQLPQIITAIIDGFKNGLFQFAMVGKSMLEGIWVGIKSMQSWLKEQITGLLKDLVVNVKQTLKINSPSKVFAEIGEYMGEGVGVGFADSIVETKGIVINSMNDVVTSVLKVQKQANEKITKEQEEANKKTISLIKDAAKKQCDAEKEAVKDNFDTKLDIISDKLENEVSLYDDASSAKIKLYDDEYLKKIELIDEATGLSLQGINDEIEKELEKLQITNKGLYDEITARRDKILAIEAEGEAEKENQRIKKETAKLEELQSRVNSANDYKELIDARKTLSEYEERLATEQRERERKAQVEQLNTEIIKFKR